MSKERSGGEPPSEEDVTSWLIMTAFAAVTRAELFGIVANDFTPAELITMLTRLEAEEQGA